MKRKLLVLLLACAMLSSCGVNNVGNNGIHMKNGDAEVSIGKDGIIAKSGDSEAKIGKDGIIAKTATQKQTSALKELKCKTDSTLKEKIQ